VLGTGIMGAPIARNIAAAGHDVRAWNRTIEKARPLADDGVTVAQSARDAVAGADVILTMLADLEATAAVAEDALAAAEPDAVWLQTATVGVEGIERCGKLADAHRVTLVDAPVLGTRQPAQDRKLVVLASGPDEAVDRCVPVFEAIGQRTLRVGAAGAGTRLKLALNAWVLAVTAATAETIALTQGLGLEPQLALDALEGGALDLPYFRTKAKLMLEGDFPPSFPLALAAKDAGLVREAAERSGLDLALARALADRFASAAQAGFGEEDMAAVYRLAAPAARAER
jgi:3-hydroxyisobutyrate dehydrogenase